MAFTYEDVNPTLIPNTTMQKRLRDGVDYQYLITPIDGYVLHSKPRDWEDENGDIQRGYSGGTASCSISYDFTPLTVQITDNDGNTLNVTAYGSQYEFFAIPETTAPENNIFSLPNNTVTE